MNVAMWAAVREYIAAEFALEKHRFAKGNPIMSLEVCAETYPTLYAILPDDSPDDVVEKNERRADKAKWVEKALEERAELEAHSTRMETAVREAVEAFEERIKTISQIANQAHERASERSSLGQY